ncbi:HD domain-containing phosphohydrolase [Arhodomonas sp. AD133]|uniref:HD domain-containing phosphohydrolase n=1 Tax=Arhodomonas sp. AD133 TaxID=3415009 RepID=UPI003EB86E73
MDETTATQVTESQATTQRPASVLCVDDEANVVSALRRELRRQGYEVHTATDAAGAESVLDAHTIDAVICDFRLGSDDGVTLLARFAQRDRTIARILLTAYGDYDVSRRAINEGQVFALLEKPWSPEELQTTLAAALQVFEHVRSADALRTTEHSSAPIAAELRELCHGLLALETPAKRGHGERVAELMEEFGHHLRLDENRIAEAVLAAKVHDIGEIALPDDVQRTPQSRLIGNGAKEFHRHPEIGESLLNASTALKGVARLVRAHHERFDGRGFPDGLSGNDIPIAARILSVIDTFDEAMHGHILRRRLTESDARDLILRERGQRFDPRAVNAFFRWYKQRQPADEGTHEGIPVTDLQPGMVLAKDLTTPEGFLLLPAGHRVNEALLQRVQTLAARHGDSLRAFVIGGKRHD